MNEHQTTNEHVSIYVHGWSCSLFEKELELELVPGKQMSILFEKALYNKWKSDA